ncbi:MAG TPA: peroxiredoxin [Bryobacteraceae bacterium]|jgi:peroxiredoxin Q/BCP|nr:peroxiredoxin [Bryobacteraceae bacterium]
MNLPNFSSRLRRFSGVATIALTLGAIPALTEDTMPQAGQAAPTFQLPSQDGSQIGLNEYRGKWVVLYFYPKDGTTGCTIEAHNFQRDLSKYEHLNAVILGVSVDTTGSHKEFCAQQGLTFKLLADPDKKVVEQYGSLKSMMGMKIAARNTFLIDPEGKIVKVWTGVDPKTHSETVLSELTELANKKS